MPSQPQGLTAPEIQLKHRLTAWAKAYAGAQFRRLGHASTEALKAGPALDLAGLDAEADEIEMFVREMEACGCWREARVLRAEYYFAGVTEAERIHRLARNGLRISRPSYYVALKAAKVFLLAKLCSTNGACRSAAGDELQALRGRVDRLMGIVRRLADLDANGIADLPDWEQTVEAAKAELEAHEA